MITKLLKYFLLDKNGRKSWDDINRAKKTWADNKKHGIEHGKTIPVLNTPFGVKPGESGLIFTDQNPDEQINLIESAIGEARLINDAISDNLPQLSPPDETNNIADDSLKKKP